MRREFGAIVRLPSGKWRAQYRAPDKTRPSRTFLTKKDASAWLAAQQTEITRGQWTARTPRAALNSGKVVQPSGSGGPTVAEFSGSWLAYLEQAGRRHTTLVTYESLMRIHVLPVLGKARVEDVRVRDVALWWDGLSRSKGPHRAANAYRVVRSMFTHAVNMELIERNPCRVPGAGKTRAKAGSTRGMIASSEQVKALAARMPARYELAVLLAAWCQLRLGETLELRRGDIDLVAGTLSVSRQVQFKSSPPMVTPPKSQAGVRTVAIPGGLLGVVGEHLGRYTPAGEDGLLFGAVSDRRTWVRASVFRRAWERARAGVPGCEGMVFHDLRHTGLTEYARAGATVAELLARGGHSSVEVAMRYQHAAAERDRFLAAKIDTGF